MMRNPETLIEAVRCRPFLYDQSLQTFRHMATKNKNWMEVAKIVYGRDDRSAVFKVKMQWKSLRDSFVKHQRKKQNNKFFLRSYVYEKELNFLLPHILMKEKDDLPASDQLVSDLVIKTEDPLIFYATVEEEEEREAKQPKLECVDEPLEQPQEEKSKIMEMDPVDAFFHGVAQTVKKLKPATVARLKKAVANLVMDAEIEEINNSAETSSRS